MNEAVRKWTLKALRNGKLPAQAKARIYYAMLNGGND
jgi:hypothetical protein